eukprot:Skav224969  [mRNA]  locus=scaffold3807:25883:33251:+ [translate_table: standard]
MNGREVNGHVMTVRLANNDTTGPGPRTAARNAPPPVVTVAGGTNLYVSGLPPEGSSMGAPGMGGWPGDSEMPQSAPGAAVHISGLPPGGPCWEGGYGWVGFVEVQAKLLDDGSQGSPPSALLRLGQPEAERLVADFDGQTLQGTARAGDGRIHEHGRAGLERPLSVRIVPSESSRVEREGLGANRYEPYGKVPRVRFTATGGAEECLEDAWVLVRLAG